MSVKRFRARRRFAHTRVWLIAAFILVVCGTTLYAITDVDAILHVLVVAVVVGLSVALWIDRRERTQYILESGYLLMKRGRTTERLDLSAVRDASLVDRRAARELLMDRIRSMEEQGLIAAEREEFQRRFVHWCTVPLGLGAFAIAGDLLEGRSDGKHDLVLLRMSNGRSLLLSPVYNQDLIGALNKNKEQDEQRRRRA